MHEVYLYIQPRYIARENFNICLYYPYMMHVQAQVDDASDREDDHTSDHDQDGPEDEDAGNALAISVDDAALH